MAQKQEVDFVSEVAHRIPAAIALSLMGVPEQDWDRLAELEHITVTGTDPEFTHGQAEPGGAEPLPAWRCSATSRSSS